MRYHTDRPVYWDKPHQFRVQRSDEENAAGYRRWRGSIEFTDEQIEAALIEFAADHPDEFIRRKRALVVEHFKRTHRLTRYAFISALPYAIKVCTVVDAGGETCGRKALYRQGDAGRCRDHRRRA